MTKKIGKITQIKKLKNSLHLSKAGKEKVRKSREEISKIIKGELNKKILIIGPCSIDFEESVLEYAEFLKGLKQKYSDKLEIIMRFYTGKPRSTIGWKGILYNNPGKEIDLKKGIKKARKLAIKLIEEYDMTLADELLYPELSARLWDLYSYMAIGARSTENQLHREVASGLNFPVGIKNPTSGDLKTMINGVFASQNKSSYILERIIYETPGNLLSHGILRGGTYGTNYNLENIEKIYKYFRDNDIKNPAIIIDCNHDNSGKNPDKQIEIIKEVMGYFSDEIKKTKKQKVQERKDISKLTYLNVSEQEILHSDEEIGNLLAFLKGFMVESYLYDGRQDLLCNSRTGYRNLIKGKSLTDPCIGKEKTEKLIGELYKLV